MQFNLIKKIAVLALSAIMMSALYVTPSSAAEGEGEGGGSSTDALLKAILDTSNNILLKVNDFPTYAAKMVEYALNLQKPDDSEATKAMQTQFAETGKAIAQNANTQISLLPTFNTAQLGSKATKETLPNANDLVFSTLLGQPVFSPDPRNKPGEPPTANPQQNYIVNAAGLGVPHTIPRYNWRGTPDNISRYVGYYNTTMAVESYNAFVLANLLADAQSGNSLTKAQMALVAQASDSEKWFTIIASEEIGKVLRQLLMFESQSYVLMTQLLQTQKQQLAAQVMTNAMLAAGQQVDERSMLEDAQGTR